MVKCSEWSHFGVIGNLLKVASSAIIQYMLHNGAVSAKAVKILNNPEVGFKGQIKPF